MSEVLIEDEALEARRSRLSPAKLALLQKQLRQKASKLTRTEMSIPRRPEGDTAPLSFAQQRLWFLDQLEPGGAAYNCPTSIRIEGRLDPAALLWSIEAVVRRHESLRTTFAGSDGRPVQVISGSSAVRLPLVDLRSLPADLRLSRAVYLAVEERLLPFDLSCGPLLRVTLLRLADEDHVLLLTMHHIVSDGWSLSIFVHEVGTFYEAFHRGLSASLPEPAIQYADFAAWQRQRLQGEALQAEVDHWRRTLAGAPPVLELPTRRGAAGRQTPRSGNRAVQLTEELSAQLRSFALGEGATLFMVLLGGLAIVLSRWSGQDDVVVGTSIANRNRVETRGVIGFFINILLMRCDLAGEPTVRELIGRLKDMSLEAFAHEDLPFEKLVEELKPDRSIERSPLFQVMLTFQNTPEADVALSSLRLLPFNLDVPVPKFELMLEIADTPEGLRGGLEFDANLFDPALLARLPDHLTSILRSAIGDPDGRLSSLSLLTAPERHQVLTGWNDTAAPLSRALLPELFATQARRTPQREALVHGEERLSYAALQARAVRIAAALRSLSVRPESLVGVFLERTPEMVATLLGILQAGAAYLPLDPTHPAERLRYILDDSRAVVVLTESALADRLPAEVADRIILLEHLPADAPAAFGPARIWPESLAYVMYTSGSTGRPKGVAVPHRGLAAFATWAADLYSPEDFAGVLASTSICFDISVLELFVPLIRGGRVILADDALELPQVPAAAEVVMVQTVPSAMRELVRLGALPSSVRVVSLGGEPLSRVLAQAIYALPSVERVIDLYGPTEDSVYSTWSLVGRGGEEEPFIGRPITNGQAYVADRALQLAPVEVSGELLLGGAGLARGYLNRPELTAERFVPDPFGGERGARLYRTGDLVRWRGTGELEFLGRIDHQVKVRGFRIELGEIEAVLSHSPLVGDNVVVARADGGDLRLVAYVVPVRGALQAPELRSWLHQHLPSYMVPGLFIELEALPLTPNGKVDRKALPAPDLSALPGAAAVHVSPRTPVEGVLADIWGEVLGIAQVGVQTSFFDLGGHSLLATQVVARVRQTFAVELPLRKLFQAPTVAALAAEIEAELRSGRALEVPPLLPVPRDGSPLPLSFAQQRLWFLDQLAPGSSAYNLSMTVRLEGPLDIRALAASLREVVRRHEALRTLFTAVDVEPRQWISPAGAWEMAAADLSCLDADRREEEARRQASFEEGRPFDLTRGSLFRALLLRLGGKDHVVVATMHHIVSDGWSMEILIREVATLYEAFAAARLSPLAELPVQYADFAVWQRQWLRDGVLESHLDWWRERLAGSPALLELPMDRPRPPVQSFRGAVEPVRLPAELVARLRDAFRRQEVTLFMALLGGFQTLLSRYARSLDVSVGTPIAGRTHVEMEELIGFFVNTLVLRTDLSGDPALSDLLSRVREMVLEAHLHQDVPFEKLVEALDPERSLSRTPLFQVMFALQNVPRRELTVADLRMLPLETGGATAKFDLSLTLMESEGELVGSLEYATDLFDRVTMERLLGHLERLLGGMAARPAARLSSYSLLGAEEEQQLLLQWNDTAQPWPVDSTLPGLFALQAERTPWAEALVWGEQRLSYADLRARAGRIAAGLQSLGVGPESLVGVLLERTPEMVASLLGVLQAGAAYLPLEANHPAERIGYIVAESRASVVLSQSSLAERLPAELGVRRVLLDGGWPGEMAPGGPSAVRIWPESLAYTIYTSGSTGRPKGVAISHRSAVAMLAWSEETFSAEELSGVLASTSITFDMSVFELFATLAHGGRAILARDALELPELPAMDEVRLINTVPSAMRELVRLGAVPASVRTVNLGGEPLSRSLVESVYASSRVERVFNLYGPSEDTTYSTWSLVERGAAREPSIGRPLSNSQAYVVDGELCLVPGGVPGELLLAGAGLARGYLHRPELTAERFVPDPFGVDPGGRVYRTGDLVRWRWTGELEYLGRFDHQVKVRGFRVELGEIEAALVSHPEVREGVVVVHGSEEARRLVAYAVAVQGALAVAELRAWLQRRLPDYMVPAVFVELSALPLSPNGKIDRKALPAPEAPREAVYLAPRTPSEEIVASIFLDVLGVERVGALGHFFELGGHSLLAMQVVSRLRQAFQVELPLRRLFEAPTVAALAVEIEAELRSGRGLELPPLVPAARDGSPLPLSFAQQRLWFLDQLEPGSSLYNIPLALRVRGRLSLPALAQSLGEIARRHEPLRTVFAALDGSPVQVIHPAGAVQVPMVDLSGVPAMLGEQLLLLLAAATAGTPFDLARGPVLRAGVIRLGEEDHVVLLTMHHIVSDGWSVGVLAREITALYSAAVAGSPSPLPELRIQYADYAEWQRGWLQGETLERELAYWREQLSGQTAMELPTDRPRSAARSQRGGVRSVQLSPDLALALQALGRREGATLFMVLLAGFQALLARLGRQEEISIGTPIAGRNQVELEGLIGFFVNTLVLRTSLGGEPELRELLGRVRESALGAYAHQDLPFERLVEEMDPVRDPSRTPLFQAMLTLEEGVGGGRLELAGLAIDRVALASATAKFDLKLALSLTDGGLEGMLEYAQDLFDATTIERWAAHLGILLAAAAAARPEDKVADLPLFGAAERHQLVHEWSSAEEPAGSAACVHELFAAQAAATPEALAIICGEGWLTYRELDRRANRLAHTLQALGVTPDTPVGLLLERSAALIVAVLGVLKAGGAYLPLDPAFPVERLALMLEDAGAPVVLTRAGRAPELPGGIRVLSNWEGGDGGDAEAASPDSGVTAGHLAYVIYTSGSTGRPKGVMVEHRQLVSYLRGMIERLELPAGLSFALVQALTADAAKTTIYGALLTGGCLHVVPEELAADAEPLDAYLKAYDIDWLKLAPSHLAALWSSPRAARVAPRRYLVLGGEASPRGWAEAILAAAPGCAVINQYGPTETTVGVLTYRSRAERLPPGALTLPLGRPLPGSRIHLLDRSLAPVPVGVAGELCVAGSGLARGYLGAPAQTAERFVPDPLGSEPGGRLYRTGDLVRSWPDGVLEFVGRADNQVKIRGFRVELGEVEAALKAHPGLVDAVVVAREPAAGGRRLIAYVVAREPLDARLDARRLRELLGERLPAYMVPPAFVFLDELPRTPHGKVDRRALPDPERTEPAGSVAPRTPIEGMLAAIWGEVLGREGVGVEESFFDLGGHSLLATRLMSRVRAEFAVELPLRRLFEAPTVAGLAVEIEAELRSGRGLAAPPLLPAPRDGSPLPLSFAQQRLWFLDQLVPGSSAYNLPVTVRLVGPLDIATLGASLREVVRRHEALRTTFEAVDGEPRQWIQPAGGWRLAVADLSGLSVDRREEEVRRQASLAVGRPFDLARDPLLRGLLLRLGGEDHVVAATMHHIVSDGWSLELLIQEVSALYEAFAAGRPSPLPELSVQYGDFAAWQRQWLHGEVLEAHLGWWRERLAGAPALLELPTDRPRPPVQSSRGAVEPVRLPAGLVQGLRNVARQHGVTLFMVLLGGFQALLSRYARTLDVSVGTPTAGRTYVEIEELIGFFINTLVLRTDLSGDPGLGELLGRIRETALETHLHQDVPFEKLVEALDPERSLSRTPLFQVMFALQNVPRRELTVADLRLLPLEVARTTAKFDLSLSLVEFEEELVGSLEYATDLFDRVSMARLLAHLERLLGGMVAEPSGRLSSCSLLAAAEQAQVTREWNDTEVPHPSAALLHELIAAQALRTPGAVAVSCAGRELTYGELWSQMDRLARTLRTLGVGPEVRVGLCLERSPELVVGLLGVLAAGGTYVPMDPEYPRARLLLLVKDSRASVVLTQERLVHLLPATAASLLILDAVREAPEVPDVQVPELMTGLSALPANTAYVLFTSGSTGNPKGVMIPHRALTHHMLWMQSCYPIGEGDCLLQKTPIGFDASVWEFFAPLLVGGRLAMAPAGEHRDPVRLVERLRAERVTVLQAVPTLLKMLLEQPGLAACRDLRRVYCGGEVLEERVKQQFRELLPEVELINLYGPTETTIQVSSRPFLPGEEHAVSIGRPIHNAQLYVVDDRLEPLPIGVAGQLLAGGHSLARGYLDRPDLTAERFLPDPFGEVGGGRLYRTGDLVRWRSTGELEYLGRIDQQVKVRGFRVELGEIEAVLGSHPAVREGVVEVRGEGEGRRLVAYAVAAEGALPVAALRAWLLERLPDYMVPAVFMELLALPLSPNGKLDRKGLPEPTLAEAADRFLAARTPVEEMVAGIWAEVLKVDRPGVQTSFFDLGGHSLLATQVMSRVRRAFGVDLPLRALFEEPTVAAFAGRIEAELRTGRGLGSPPLLPAPRDGSALPLSFAQQRIWFLAQLDPGSTAYNLPVAMRLAGPLDVGALRASLREVVWRHEALRTTFVTVAGEPGQRIDTPTPAELPLVDLAGLSAELREAEARRQASLEAGRGFDLERGPLFRTLLLRLAGDDHLVAATMHHIVSDGWSLELLIREVSALYSAFVEGRPSPLAELPVQYGDFAVWQRQWLRGEILEAHLGWWRERLAGAPALLELPTDRPRPPVQGSRGAVEPVRLPAALVQGLRDVARRHGVTLFMALLGGFQTLLSRYARSLDVSVGTPTAGRTHVEIEELIGFFINTLVLRTDLSGDPELGDLLGRIRETALETHLHQDVPFEKLVEALDPERSLSRTPLFQVMFALQNVPRRELTVADLRLVPLATGGATAKFDLSLSVVESETEELVGALEYATDLFDRVTVSRLLAHLELLLGGMAARPAAPLSSYSLLGAEEEQQLLLQWNDTARPWAVESTLPGLFALQAARTPRAEALVWGEQRLSYAELSARAGRIAAGLQSLGVGPESQVGVLLERTPEMVASLLGVLQAGAAYLPLDASHPAERIAYIVAESRASVVLSQSSLVGRLPADLAVQRVLLDGGWPGAAAPAVPSAVRIWPESLAYTIFTSGSTGRPKGVAIAHRSAVAMLAWAAEMVSAEELAGVLASTSITFDMSVFELFATLTRGGRAILARDALALPELAAAHEVRLINTVPSAMRELVRLGAVPASVRTVNLGGEPLSRALVEAIYSTSRVERVFNLYGPSEDTTYSTWSLIERGSPREPLIGRQLSNTRAYVVDADLRLAPGGVYGELLLGGAGLARGYLHRPELTAERFVPDPFGEPGERLYRTGDLVRWRWTGELEYLGRMDHQVKVRGFRVELGEIEAVLGSHPAVREGVVEVRGEGEGRRLVAYAVAAEGALPVAELRTWLQRRLPDYMVPAVFVELPALPLSPNGKVDRKALPSPEAPREAVYLAPRTPSEEIVAAIFLDVLGAEQVGALGHFFELGGHSLLAMQVVSRVRQAFQVELPLRRLFEAPTVAALAVEIEAELRQGRGLAAPPLLPAPRDGSPLPLSFAQQRLWFLDQLVPGSSAYNLPVTMRLAGRMDVAALGASLREVVRRHEALRTTFEAVDGEPRQRIQPGRWRLAVADLSGLDADRREEEARRQASLETGRPFDLARDPLLRGLLLELGGEDHVVVVTMHHIGSDGWSLQLLIQEVSALYEAFTAGRPSPLAELPVQYADFAVWQRKWLHGEVLEAHLGWWRERLAGAPALLELPTDRPRPPVQSTRGSHRERPLPTALAAVVAELARRRGATPFMALLAGFEVLLARYTGQRDVVVGVPVAGRNRIEIEPLIGFFVNVLAVRTDLWGDAAFTAVLDRVRQTSLEAHLHQDLPFDRLVEELAPERSLSHSPIFQVTFAFNNVPQEARRLVDMAMEPFAAGGRSAKFDLSLAVTDAGSDGLFAAMEYNTDLFDAATVDRLLEHWEVLLAGAVAEPGRDAFELPWLGAAEAEQVVAGWNATAVAHPLGTSVHELVAEQARRAPDAPAVVRGGDRLTYGQLHQGACRLAAHLRTLGVGPETSVALLADRSPEMVLGLLAVLAAGGCYVPLDPAYPAERLAFILSDCGAAVVLSQSHLSGRLPLSGPQVVHLDTGWHLFGGRETLQGPGVLPENLAYVIYTSGSTGLPKGVQVTHRSLANLVHWHLRAYGITAADRGTQVAGLAFDAAVWELWPYLAAGASIHLPDEETRESPRRLRDWLTSSGITVSFLPTPLAEGALALDSWPTGALRALLTGGDRLHAAPPAGLGFELVNHYGPTESTVVATAGRVAPTAGGEAPSIGRAIDNVRAYVVDDAQRPVPVGVAGELLLAGAGLARGYLNRPELTAERFLPDLLGTEPGARLYRTGDRVRWRRDGELDFLGRIDQQVKVRGFRIEPGEIEAVLTVHPRLREAVVTAWGEGGARRLAAYVVATEAGAPEARELRAWLLARLPEHMVPSVFISLPALPLTPNGKVDRRALPSPASGSSAARGDITPPGNPTELALVQLWEQVLDVRPIGIRDGFFELGGHSLLAVRLLDRIERDLGVRLPLTVLFQGATVEALAAALLRQAPPSGSPLVALRTTGSRRPFFCVHAAGGDVFAYLDLARHLGPDQPFYGLRAAGLDGEGEPRAQVEEMAAAYVAAIREAQPAGPYRIGGWSMGGVVAWEMARQLHEQGESVEKLLLIDSVVPGHPTARRTDEAALLISFVLDFGLSPESLGLSIEELLAPAPERRLEALLERAKARALVPADVSTERLSARFRVFEANALAMSRYTLRPGPWPVILLRAAEPFAIGPRRETPVRSWLRHLFDRKGISLERDPGAGWSRVASGGLEIHQVPGGHFTLVREPHVRALADRIAGILTKETVHESDV